MLFTFEDCYDLYWRENEDLVVNGFLPWNEDDGGDDNNDKKKTDIPTIEDIMETVESKEEEIVAEVKTVEEEEKELSIKAGEVDSKKSLSISSPELIDVSTEQKNVSETKVELSEKEIKMQREADKWGVTPEFIKWGLRDSKKHPEIPWDDYIYIIIQYNIKPLVEEYKMDLKHAANAYVVVEKVNVFLYEEKQKYMQENRYITDYNIKNEKSMDYQERINNYLRTEVFTNTNITSFPHTIEESYQLYRQNYGIKYKDYETYLAWPDNNSNNN
jgi:hypothetical protein